MDKTTEQVVADLARSVAEKFTESDWKQLAQRIGFREQVARHPRLLRSLSWNDDDYRGHVLDMLNAMVDADPTNIDIIRAMLLGDDTAFFENQHRYKTGELLGQGGYGQVFREVDTLLDLEFARKELSPSPFVTDEVIGRFLREARILFRLSHPHIISVRDVGRMGRNAYIRMELFEGKQLNSLGQVPPDRARRIIAMIASALAHAHARGVIHRDLKPSNVLVLDNDIRVIDFGMGAFIEADLDTRLTRTDQSVAGGSFAAPELKENPRLRDPRCDLYSAGAVWFNLVAGRDPSGAGLEDVLKEVGDVPSADRELILRCMSPIEKRPGNAAELLRLVEGLSSDGPAKNASTHTNELTEDETRVMAAFAISYPFHGDTVEAAILRSNANHAKLSSDLRYGLAVTSLEGRGYMSQFSDQGDRYWSLSATGRNWLSRNSDTIVRLNQNDLADDIPF
jgi:eukaryotic-like serine/threonine-protein kinase